MQHFLTIVSRRWIEILVVAAVTTAAATAFGSIYNKTAFGSTLFINIGAKQFSAESPYETVQAADHFSESIQGWFKNPQLLEHIRRQSGYEVDFSARKQEKQNLIITFKTETEAQAKRIAQVSEEFLRSEIGDYNRETGSEFGIALFDRFTRESALPLGLFAALGLVLGLLLGFGIGSLHERLLKELKQFAHSKS